MTAPLQIAVVLGSVTPPGRLRRALTEAVDRARAAGTAHIELIDLAGQRIAFADGVPGERAARELDELLAAVGALAQALRDAPPLGPAPLAARF